MRVKERVADGVRGEAVEGQPFNPGCTAMGV